MKVVAMVPIKLNSERVKGKNLRRFSDGTPLLQFILKSLLESKFVEEVYVYCSSETVRKYLPDGVRFLKRPAFLDSNTANCNDIIREFIKVVDSEYYVVSHATAPFTSAETIDSCVKSVVDSIVHDSAFTVTKFQNFLWQNGVPLNFDPSCFPRTQDLTPIYSETSGVFVFPKKVFEKYNRRVGEHPYLLEVDKIESLDIDTEEDLKIAQAVFEYVLKGEHITWQ